MRPAGRGDVGLVPYTTVRVQIPRHRDTNWGREALRRVVLSRPIIREEADEELVGLDLIRDDTLCREKDVDA